MLYSKLTVDDSLIQFTYRYAFSTRDDSFRRFRTTLASSSTPSTGRDGRWSGRVRILESRATSKKRRRNAMQLFSIIMESRRVRGARAACLFYAIFRSSASKERVDRSDRFLPRAVSLLLPDNGSLLHPATSGCIELFFLYTAPL